LLWQVPFGQPSSLHPLRQPVPRCCSGTSQVLQGCPTSQVRSSSACVLRLPDASRGYCCPGRDVGSPGSRARCFRTCSGSLTARDFWYTSRYRCTRWSLPHTPTASASRSECLSRLNTRPATVPCQRFDRRPREQLRMTRGRCGSLFPLSCDFFHSLQTFAGLSGAQEKPDGYSRIVSYVLEAKAGKEKRRRKVPGKQDLPWPIKKRPRPIWFALRLGPATFGVFDAFTDEKRTPSSSEWSHSPSAYGPSARTVLQNHL